MDVRICFVGDSFVNGTGDRTFLGWTGRLCAMTAHPSIELTHYNLGVRRETSGQIAQRWQAEVRPRLPDSVDGRIVFCFGTNDTTLEQERSRVEPEDSLRHARAMLTAAHACYPVLMISPPPIADAEQNQRTAQRSMQLAQLCETIKIPYLDVFTPLTHSALWMQQVVAGDGAHPAEEGYEEFARLVYQWAAWHGWFPHLGACIK